MSVEMLVKEDSIKGAVVAEDYEIATISRSLYTEYGPLDGKSMSYTIRYQGKSREDAVRKFLEENTDESLIDIFNITLWMTPARGGLTCQAIFANDKRRTLVTTKYRHYASSGETSMDQIREMRREISKIIAARFLAWLTSQMEIQQV